MEHESPALDPEQILAAGGARACAEPRLRSGEGRPLVLGWLERTLMEGFWVSSEDSHDEHGFKLAAAREMVSVLAPPGTAGFMERVLAVQFAWAHGAAAAYQARACLREAGAPLRRRRAHSRHLPEAARDIAQRYACRLMDTTVRQMGALTRLATERRKAKHAADLEAQAARYREEKRAELERDKLLAGRSAAFSRAFPAAGPAPEATEPEPTARDTEAVERVMNDFSGLPDFPIGSGIPTADAEPPAREEAQVDPPPLNRRQRRALKRQERMQRRPAQGP